MFNDDKHMTRRGFLDKNMRAAASLTAAGALASTDAFSAQAKKERAKKKDVATKKTGQMRFGLTTYTLGKPWDIPTIIANCTKAEVFGVELRTTQNYAHGVEITLAAEERIEVKKQFKDSPLTLLGLASSVKFDLPDPEAFKEAVETAKAHMKLSHDIGGSGVRVFPNAWHEDVPHEVTIAQIAKGLNEVGTYADGLGQQVRLECHGTAGYLSSIAQIMEQVDQPSVRVKLNSSSRDNEGDGFKKNFRKVKKYLGDTLHVHDMRDEEFPHQLQMDLLMNMGWDGWWLLETGVDDDTDRLQELIAQRKMWDNFFKTSLANQKA
jgi:sugar phosphate isomerase/epimerase